MVKGCAHSLGSQRVVDCLRKTCADILWVNVFPTFTSAFNVAGHCGFQAGEREIVLVTLLVLTGSQASGKTDRFTVPLLGEAVNMRATRVGQVKETSNLIEGFTGSIVKSASQFTHVGSNVIDQQQIGVSARNNKANEAFWQRAVSQFIDSEVTNNVIHTVEGFPDGTRQSLSCANADGEGAYQARPRCDGDGINLVKGNASFIKGSLQRGEEGFKVSAGGNFGDDAAVAGVFIHRGGSSIR